LPRKVLKHNNYRWLTGRGQDMKAKASGLRDQGQE